MGLLYGFDPTPKGKKRREDILKKLIAKKSGTKRTSVSEAFAQTPSKRKPTGHKPLTAKRPVLQAKRPVATLVRKAVQQVVAKRPAVQAVVNHAKRPVVQAKRPVAKVSQVAKARPVAQGNLTALARTNMKRFRRS